jgi:hypothetical protein
MSIRHPITGVLGIIFLMAGSGEACNGSFFFVPATRSEHCSLAALSEIVVDCAIASGLGTIGEPIIEISQAHNCSGGIIVFQFFRRHAHLCGALAKMN